jgi:crotonobetainyl-CoA:carnitine CoA-transferase CaiB-like acyl-CoA transferase
LGTRQWTFTHHLARLRQPDGIIPPYRLAPELGAHTDSILSWLGYSDAQIETLRERKAIR